jgi:hypothetical protein
MWWEETWAEGKGRDRHDRGRECHSVTAERNVTAIAEGNVVEGNVMAKGRKGRVQESTMMTTEGRGPGGREGNRWNVVTQRGREGNVTTEDENVTACSLTRLLLNFACYLSILFVEQ